MLKRKKGRNFENDEEGFLMQQENFRENTSIPPQPRGNTIFFLFTFVGFLLFPMFCEM